MKNTRIRHALGMSLVATSLALGSAALAAEASSGKDISPLAASDRGEVTGRVYNSATKSYLKNAQVKDKTSGKSTFTDDEGRFSLKLPVGQTALVVTYAELDFQVVNVDVAAAGTNAGEIALSSKDYSEVITLSAFVVATEKEGKAAAISQQRQADSMVNVISSDEFSNVTSGNVGDFLRNLPGIAVDYSGNDPRSIRVRGMDPNMNGISVDGVRTANAASGNTDRKFELEMTSLENIESVELFKTATPAQDADSGGGGVNLISKSAFKLKGRRINYAMNVSATGNDFTLGKRPGPGEDRENYKLGLGASFTYMNSFFKNRLGVTLTFKDYTFLAHVPGVSTEYSATPTALGKSVWDPDGIYVSTFGYSVSTGSNRRKSASVNLDYRWSENTVLWLNTSAASNGPGFGGLGFGRGIKLATAAPVATTATTNRVAAGFTDEHLIALGDASPTLTTATTSTSGTYANVYAGDVLRKIGNTVTFTGGARSKFGPWKIDYTGSYSQSLNHYRLGFPNSTFGKADFYLRGISYELNTPHYSDFPTFTQLAGPDIYDLSNYVSNSGTTNSTTNTKTGSFMVGNTRDNNARDEWKTIKANVRRDFTTLVPFYVQAGVQRRSQYRKIDMTGRRRWFYVGPDGIANTADDYANLGQFLDTSYGSTSFDYRRAPYPSLNKITQYYKDHPNAFLEDVYYNIQTEAQGLKRIKEDVDSAYFMISPRLGRLTLLAGVRYEQTNDWGEGPVTNSKASAIAGITDRVQQAKIIYASTRTSSSATYDNFFPNAQARFDITKDLMVRASYNKTIGRQNFGNVIPGVSIGAASTTTGLSTITVNNTALKPQMFDNYDVSLEYYISGSSMVSVGAFHKDIKNYTRSFDQTIVSGVDYNVDGVDMEDYIGSTLRRSENVGSAKVDGLELNYTQQLSSLSSRLRNFSAFANYTYLKTQGNYGATNTTTLPLDNFVPRTFNWGVNYRAGRFDMQAKVNYKGTYATSAANYRYNLARQTVDLSFGYKFYGNHSAYLELRNVFNAPARTFNWGSSRIRSYSVDGTGINFGIKGSF